MSPSLRERLAMSRLQGSGGGGFGGDRGMNSGREVPGLPGVFFPNGRADAAMKGARSVSRWMTDKEGHPGVEWSRGMAGIGGNTAADDMKGSIWDTVMGRLGEKGIYRDDSGTWRMSGSGTGGTSDVPSPGLGGVPSGSSMMTGGGFPSAANGQNQAMRDSMFGPGFPFNQGDGMIGGRPVAQGPYAPGKTMTSVGGVEPPGVSGVPGTANTGMVPVFPQPGLGGVPPTKGPIYNPAPGTSPSGGVPSPGLGGVASPPPYPPGGQGVGSTSAVRQGELPAPPPSTSTTNQGTYTPSGQTTVITAKDGKQYSIDPNTGYATEVPPQPSGGSSPSVATKGPVMTDPYAQPPTGGSSPSVATKGPVQTDPYAQGPVGGGYDPSMSPLQGFTDSPSTTGQAAPAAPGGGGAPIASTPPEYAPMVQQAADTHGVPANILSALLERESSWNPNAYNPSGAAGMGQFMPGTAAEMGLVQLDANGQPIPGTDKRYDANSSIDAAAQYLKQNYDATGSWDLAVAAYHAGLGSVQQAGNQIPNTSDGLTATPDYVNQIMTAAGPVDAGTQTVQNTGTVNGQTYTPSGQPTTLTAADGKTYSIDPNTGYATEVPAGTAPGAAPAAAPAGGLGAPTNTTTDTRIAPNAGGITVDWNVVNQYDPLFTQYGEQYGVDPAILKSIASAETQGALPNALMQVQPNWQSILPAGLDVNTPEGQVAAAAILLSGQAGGTPGDWESNFRTLYFNAPIDSSGNGTTQDGYVDYIYDTVDMLHGVPPSPQQPAPAPGGQAPAPQPGGQVPPGPAGQIAGVTPGGGQAPNVPPAQGNYPQQPSMTNTGIDTSVRNMMLGGQNGMSGLGDQIRNQVAGQLGQAGLGQGRQPGGVAGMPNMSGLGDQIRQQVAGQMGRAGIGGGRDLGAEIRGKVQSQLGQAGLGGVGQTGGALGGRDIGADIRQRVAMQMDRAGLGGVGQIGGSGRGVTAPAGGVPPGPTQQISGVSPGGGGYPAPAPAPQAAPAPAPAPAPQQVAPAPAATPQTVDATGEAAATSEPQYITDQKGQTYSVAPDGTATPVQMTTAADGKTYAVDETGYATEIAPAATEGTYNATPAAEVNPSLSENVVADPAAAPSLGDSTSAPREPMYTGDVVVEPTPSGGIQASPGTDESYMTEMLGTDGYSISSEYKGGVVGNWYGYQEGHEATASEHAAYDIAAPRGTPVTTTEGLTGTVSCANGQGDASKMSAGNAPCQSYCTGGIAGDGSLYCDGVGYGTEVVLDNQGNNEISVIYGHMQVTNVQPGQYISPGTQIGEVGYAGTGDHLHLEAHAYCPGQGYANDWKLVDPTLVADGYYQSHDACAAV